MVGNGYYNNSVKAITRLRPSRGAILQFALSVLDCKKNPKETGAITYKYVSSSTHPGVRVGDEELGLLKFSKGARVLYFLERVQYSI